MNWNGLELPNKPYYQDVATILYNGDCRSMSELPDETIQMVVTSPPYWGLRKYAGLPDLIWGEDGSCEHSWKGGFQPPTKMGGEGLTDGKLTYLGDHNKKPMPSQFCIKCGDWKGQLGLETTPELYISHLVEIFREVRRVLRKDGVCFVNIGDSYMSHIGDVRKVGGFQGKAIANNPAMADSVFTGYKSKHPILKDKDLCLIPFRLAIALQEDGWWVRSVIIWNKPNPMPESVTDRPSESHEYILMLTKSAKYYWDMEAVREANVNPNRTNYTSGKRIHGINPDRNDNDLGYRSESFVVNGRNLRSVWEFSTQSYKEAHFATYPEKLVEICVKAATPEVGCCSKCGRPWVRITKPTEQYKQALEKAKNQYWYADLTHNYYGNKQSINAEYQTLGWKPQCKCNADKIPSIVLDPFAGSGTTLAVAKRLGRCGVGYELSEQYCSLAVKRIEAETSPMRLE